MRRRLVRSIALGSAAVMAIAACGGDDDGGGGAQTTAPGTGGGGAECDAPGVTDTEIKVGLLGTITGFAGQFEPNFQGARSFVEALNAAGGVNGRKIVLVEGDDVGTPDGNLAHVRRLVESEGVFGLMQHSIGTDGGAEYLISNGIPNTGFGFPQVYANPDALSVLSPVGRTTGFEETIAKWHQQQGVTKAAVIGLQDPTSVDSVNRARDIFAAVGVPVGFTDNSAPFGATDFTAQAQKAQDEGVDGVMMTITSDMALGVVKSFKQVGVETVSLVSQVGYDQRVLDSGGADADGLEIPLPYQPFESGRAEVAEVKAALDQYEPDAPLGDGVLWGWAAAHLMTTGIELAGDCPTREAWVSALRALTDYDAGGLMAGTTDFTPEKYFNGPKLQCVFYVRAESGAFVSASDEPVCGDS